MAVSGVETYILQPLIGLRGNTSARSELIQPEAEWFDTMDAERAVVMFELLEHSPSATVDIFIETSDSVAGPWTQINSSNPTPPDSAIYTLSRQVSDGANRLRRWVRWRISDFNSAANIAVAFRILITIR